MNELWRRTRELVGRYWGNLGIGGRVGLLVCLAIVGGSVASMIGLLTKENLVVLAGPDRSADERAQIKTILEERKIDFQIRGDSILMTPENRDRASLELAGEGVYSERQIFSWLEDLRLTATRWSSMRQWQVALGRRLAQFLRRSDAYQEVDVHIGSEAEGRRLGEPETEAGAAVRIRMKPGEPLTKKRVRAIANIVASAVPEIKAQNVTVFDTATGEAHQVPPEDDAARTSAFMSDLEDERAERLRNDLENALRVPFPRATALVGVKLTRSQTTRQEVQPGETAPVRTSETTLHDTMGITQPQVGIVDQVPVRGDQPSSTRNTDRTESAEERENLSGFTTTNTQTPAGELDMVAVSVIIPEALSSAEERVKQAFPADQQGNVDLVQVVTEIVKGAIPIAAEKLNISVKFLPPPPAPPEVTATFWEGAQAWFALYYKHVILLALTLAGLVLAWRMVRGAFRGRAPVGLEDVAKALEEPEELLKAREMETAGTRMRSAIREVVSRNPRAVAGILKRWLAMR